jgi:hypothetical protein
MQGLKEKRFKVQLEIVVTKMSVTEQAISDAIEEAMKKLCFDKDGVSFFKVKGWIDDTTI